MAYYQKSHRANEHAKIEKGQHGPSTRQPDYDTSFECSKLVDETVRPY